MTYLPDTPRSVRRFITLVTAVAGLLTMAAILTVTGGSDGTEGFMLAGAFLGAGCSGLLLAGLLGHRTEQGGIWIGIIGTILTTGLGSFLGGVFWASLSLASDGHFAETDHVPEVMSGLLKAAAFAFVIVMTFVPAEIPHVMGIWIMLMTGVHIAALRARQRTAA